MITYCKLLSSLSNARVFNVSTMIVLNIVKKCCLKRNKIMQVLLLLLLFNDLFFFLNTCRNNNKKSSLQVNLSHSGTEPQTYETAHFYGN